MGINEGCDLFTDVKDIPDSTPVDDKEYAKNANVVNWQQLANAISLAPSGTVLKPKYIGLTDLAENPIIETTTAAGKVNKYLTALVACRKEITVKFKNDGVQFASVRLGPANPTELIIFSPVEDVVAGKNITVEFTKAFSSQNVDLEVYLRGVEQAI